MNDGAGKDLIRVPAVVFTIFSCYKILTTIMNVKNTDALTVVLASVSLLLSILCMTLATKLDKSSFVFILSCILFLITLVDLFSAIASREFWQELKTIDNIIHAIFIILRLIAAITMLSGATKNKEAYLNSDQNVEDETDYTEHKTDSKEI